MRLFITGGTGYIGRALCRRLREDGHEVRVLVRPTSDVEWLRALGVETFTGDVTDRASMREGMSGADWVIHAAAELDLRAPEERMRRVNVEGSDNVASLAYKLGIGQFLSVSSMAYFGGSPDDGRPVDETATPITPFPSAYSATKYEGEEAVRAWARRGLRVNTVYPGLVYGPPGKHGGANGILRQLLRRRLPALAGAGRKSSWVFLDDVVDAIVRVMAQAAPGRDYLLTGDVTTLRDLARRVCALGGVAAPRLELPLGLARAGIVVAAPLFRLAGRRPPFVPQQLRSLGRHWAFDDGRARRELGWAPRGLDAGLPPTVEFLQAS